MGAFTEEVVEVLWQRRQQVSIGSRWEQEHKSTGRRLNRRQAAPSAGGTRKREKS